MSRPTKTVDPMSAIGSYGRDQAAEAFGYPQKTV
jgi:hypothetical protein